MFLFLLEPLGLVDGDVQSNTINMKRSVSCYLSSLDVFRLGSRLTSEARETTTKKKKREARAREADLFEHQCACISSRWRDDRALVLMRNIERISLTHTINNGITQTASISFR